MLLILCLKNLLLQLFQSFSLFPCWEITSLTRVMIITIKSMFWHSMKCPLHCSNYHELKKSRSSSYIRCLCIIDISLRCLWVEGTMRSVASSTPILSALRFCGYINWNYYQLNVVNIYKKQLNETGKMKT